jgi:hypothetical protein
VPSGEPRNGRAEQRADHHHRHRWRTPSRLAAGAASEPSGGAVRSIPRLVRSKAHASPAETGKPSASTATTTCSTAKENRPHASSARMTRRRLSSWNQAARSTESPGHAMARLAESGDQSHPG